VTAITDLPRALGVGSWVYAGVKTTADSREVGMRIHWSAVWLMMGMMAAAVGCGSYSAPNNPPSSPDSTGDSTPPPPPPGGYIRN
jgi:hypothetical protein